MLKLYSSYIAASFIVPLLVSTAFFVSFLMSFELFRIMTLVSSDEISFFFILGMMGNVMTTLIPMAVPISIFFSTIFCLSQMSGDSEYVALRSAGLDKLHILRPFLIVSILVSICVYFLNQELVPDAHRSVRKKIKIISSTSLIQGLKSGQFFTNLSNITIFPHSFDDKTKELSRVFLHIFNEESRVDKIIVAKSGKIIHEKNEETGIESFKLFLKDGNIVNKTFDNQSVEKILFNEYTLPISEKKFSYKTSLKEIMMSRTQLENFIDGGFAKVEKLGFSKKEYFNARYEYWNRINTPLLCIVFTFVGFALGITSNRGRSKNSSVKAILLLITYYVLYFSFVSAAREGSLPVALCAIIPNLALLIYGVKEFRSIDWVS